MKAIHDRSGDFKPIDSVELIADPIEPSWVLAGSPQTRSGCHSVNADGWAGTYVWDCTAGRFNWYYDWEETVMILEGEVHVTDAAGTTHVMVSGSVGYFPAGSAWVWEVPAYVRKMCFYRRQVPWAARGLSRLLRMMGIRR